MFVTYTRGGTTASVPATDVGEIQSRRDARALYPAEEEGEVEAWYAQANQRQHRVTVINRQTGRSAHREGFKPALNSAVRRGNVL